MTQLTQFFMKRPMLFWSFMVAIVISGILAFIQMPKLEDPAVSAKQAMVVVMYPGASAHDVELRVAQVMEEQLRTLPDVRKIKSQCQAGIAFLTVEFQMTVLNRDIEQHFDLLRRKVNDAVIFLPRECYAPMVIDDMMDVYGVFYALTGDGYEYPELERYAEYIKRELLDIKGVKRVNIVGGRSEVINITINKEQIARNGVIPTQIMTALQSGGKTVNAGHAQANDERIAIRVDNDIRNEEDIRNLLIQTFDGKQLRLGDIATIERTYAEPQQRGFFVSGKPAIAICLAMESSANVPNVGEAIDARMEQTLQRLPAGLSTEKVFFQPDKVNEAISSFMWNLLESVLIVVVVLIFAMGWRSGLIIGLGLILTIAVSFPILLCCGTTLQRISLGAFIIAMGMLVDNSVVIMDGILVDKSRGLSPKKYLYRIGQNTAMPLLGATIIAASTFLSVYLSPDSAGEYAHDLFLVLCISLLASWVLALIQVPICAKQWLPIHEKVAKSKKPAMQTPAHKAIRRAVTSLIEHKYIAFSVAIILLAACSFGLTKVKNLFFPDFNYNQFVVECYFPNATNANIVRDNLLEMTATLEKNLKINRVSASQSSAPAHYCLVRPMTSGGDCYGELIVDCDNYNTVIEQIPLVRKQLREAYPDAYIRFRKYNFSIATSHMVEVEFAGPDPAVLRKLSAQAEDIMRRCEYVDPYSVQNNWKLAGKTLLAQYSRPDGLRSGIDRGDIANAMLAATDGMPIGVINDQDNMVLINLKVCNADGSRITRLEDIPVWSMTNFHITNSELQNVLMSGQGVTDMQDKLFRATPLGTVIKGISLQWDEDVVLRNNGRRVIEAECDPNFDRPDATPAKVIQAIKNDIEAISLPEGYTLTWRGDGELQKDAIGNLLKYVPITLFLIIFILLLLFNSWRKLALVLFCLPFVICGVAPVLYFSGTPFTFMAIIGMLGLIGMMVKNSIVLIDETTRLQDEEHKHPYHAIVEATVSRVRPVLMASITTIVGMLPLVTDPMYASMAYTIMGGLAVGTITTLVLLPIMFCVFYGIKKPNEK